MTKTPRNTCKIISINDSRKNREREDLLAQEFFYKHPFAPVSESIECYDLIIKSKKEAMKIVKGKQNLVYAKWTANHGKDIVNQMVRQYKEKLIKEGVNKQEADLYLDDLNVVHKLHIHDWKNTWYVDAHVYLNSWFRYNHEIMQELEKEYKCDFSQIYKDCQYLDLWEEFDLQPDDEFYLNPLKDYPSYLYFVIDRVLDTNLVDMKPQGMMQVVKNDSDTVSDFFTRHPDAPVSEEIDCLTLFLSKEEAKDILTGVKRVDVRPWNGLYSQILQDSKVDDWIANKAAEDGEDMRLMYTVLDPLREVDSICFRDVEGTWYLRVAVENNGHVRLDSGSLAIMHDFDYHGLDEYCKQIEAEIENGEREDDDRPTFFYFELGPVLDTNID